ncbi:unnamed protein product, partial [Pylaiella littoralis]
MDAYVLPYYRVRTLKQHEYGRLPDALRVVSAATAAEAENSRQRRGRTAGLRGKNKRNGIVVLGRLKREETRFNISSEQAKAMFESWEQLTVTDFLAKICSFDMTDGLPPDSPELARTEGFERLGFASSKPVFKIAGVAFLLHDNPGIDKQVVWARVCDLLKDAHLHTHDSRLTLDNIFSGGVIPPEAKTWEATYGRVPTVFPQPRTMIVVDLDILQYDNDNQYDFDEPSQEGVTAQQQYEEENTGTDEHKDECIDVSRPSQDFATVQDVKRRARHKLGNLARELVEQGLPGETCSEMGKFFENMGRVNEIVPLCGHGEVDAQSSMAVSKALEAAVVVGVDGNEPASGDDRVSHINDREDSDDDDDDTAAVSKVEKVDRVEQETLTDWKTWSVQRSVKIDTAGITLTLISSITAVFSVIFGLCRCVKQMEPQPQDPKDIERCKRI